MHASSHWFDTRNFVSIPLKLEKVSSWAPGFVAYSREVGPFRMQTMGIEDGYCNVPIQHAMDAKYLVQARETGYLGNWIPVKTSWIPSPNSLNEACEYLVILYKQYATTTGRHIYNTPLTPTISLLQSHAQGTTPMKRMSQKGRPSKIAPMRYPKVTQ